jgi:antitoxin HicB
MQTWAFAARIERSFDDEFVVSFADIPEALTAGETLDEARALAVDALDEAILAYMAAGRIVPLPREPLANEELVPLDPVTAARAALAQAMREERLTNVALARLMSRSEGAIRRLTDGATGVKIDTVLQALSALGRRATLAVV